MGEMSKSPEEIKKGLALCVNANSYNYLCDECPYAKEEEWCESMMAEDAIDYIQRLEAQNAELVRKTEQLERERDVALHDMKNINGNICLACKNHYRPDLSVLKFACKEFGDLRCQEVLHCGKFEWRGVPEPPEEE